MDRGWSPPSSIGPFEVLGLVGRGGMAEVYAVRHREQDQLYALKIVSFPHPRLVERFRREVELQAQLAHPHILCMLDPLEIQGRPAVLLPFVEGPSLEVLLASERLAPDLVLSLFRQIVDGVAAIHAAGLVHRDLKPGNVLLELSSGALVAKVSDFGLAKALQGERFTQTGVLLGTPAYAAPEQRRDAAHVDARADVYALGAMLAEMLTGSNEALPEDAAWGALVRRLRAQRPSHRPADAGAVAGMLPSGGARLDEPALLARCRRLAPQLRSRTLVPEEDAPSFALPAERDPFVGREADLERLAQQVAQGTRLLTVLGMGGTGKTRLVTHHAWKTRERWPGGSWFCDLCEARSADGIVSAVARALGVQLGAGDGVARLGHALAARGRCLVLLDNFEQVAAYARDTLGRWLDRAPEVHFVVTSRETLGLPGEHLLPLEPLPLEEGAELFLRRARAARSDFTPSEADLSDIRSLVRLLDGLPLAIELAAARVRVMTPGDMLSHLSAREASPYEPERAGNTGRFRLLVSQGGRSDRQATLLATLDWSWSLLSEPEREALAQLSVFEGGFDLPAVEQVLEVEGAWATDLVQGLLDKSLLQRLSNARWGLLVSVQQYAATQLQRRGGQAPAKLRHGRYFARWGSTEALERLDQRGGRSYRQTLADHLDNLGAACRRAVARADGAVAAATARACWEVYDRYGPVAAGGALIEAALTVPDLPREEVGPLRAMAGVAALHLGRVQAAREHGEAALAQDPLHGHSLLGRLYAQQGRRDEARYHFEQGLICARQGQDRRREASILCNQGCLEWRTGEPIAAERHFHEALALARELGFVADEAIYLSNLGVAQLEQERLEDAQASYERALALHQEVGAHAREAPVLSNLGDLARKRGDLPRARGYFEAARARARMLGDPGHEGFAEGGLAYVLALMGQTEEAQRHIESGIAMLRVSGDVHELFLLLCLRARLVQQSGHSGARQALVEAQELAAQLSLAEESPLLQELASIERLLDGATS